MTTYNVAVEDVSDPNTTIPLLYWTSDHAAVGVEHVSYPPFPSAILTLASVKPLILVSGRITQMSASDTFDEEVLPFTRSKVLTASEAIGASNLVNVFDNSGTVQVRKADATVAGKEATGYVLDSVLAAATVTVYFDDVISGLSSLTPGALYFLSTTPGAITSTAPTGSGNIQQRVGRALSASEIEFQPGDPVALA